MSEVQVVPDEKRDAAVVRDEKSETGKHGHRVKIEESFMHIDVSFMRDGSLGQLKGPKLSAFVAAGLHQAEILLGDAEPFSMRDFIAETQWSKPSLSDALDYLVEHHFLVQLPGRGTSRQKHYRVASPHIWFGRFRQGAPFSVATARDAKSKDSLPLAESKKSSLDVVDVQYSFSEAEIQHQATSTAATRKIFASMRIGNQSLQKLARTVAPALAERWARWIGWAEKDERVLYSNPRGLAVCTLGSIAGRELAIRYEASCPSSSNSANVDEDKPHRPRTKLHLHRLINHTDASISLGNSRLDLSSLKSFE